MDSSTVIKHVLLISCLPPWITPSHRAVSHQRVASVGPGHCWHYFLIHFVYNSWHSHCSHWSGCCQMLKISKVRWFKICSLTFMLFILFTLFIMIAVVATGLEGHPRLLDTPLQIPAHLGEILRYILSSRSRVCPGVQWYISTRSQARGVLLVWCPNHLNCFSIRRSRGYNPSLSQIVELLKLSWRVNHAALLRNLITTPWTWDLFIIILWAWPTLPVFWQLVAGLTKLDLSVGRLEEVRETYVDMWLRIETCTLELWLTNTTCCSSAPPTLMFGVSKTVVSSLIR